MHGLLMNPPGIVHEMDNYELWIMQGALRISCDEAVRKGSLLGAVLEV